MGKVVIFCSDGFQGSNLEEIVNYSWKFPYMRKITNDDVEKEILEGPTNSYMKKNESSASSGSSGSSSSKSSSKTFENNMNQVKNIIETSETKKFNRSGLTIVTPHKEGDFLTRNYDPTNAWSLGCQFVGMNFQKMDKNMDIYINKFKKYAFVIKPKKLRTD
jgi:phenylacetate-coenzyme A ligase PaaK-like adenylate-forming protein